MARRRPRHFFGDLAGNCQRLPPLREISVRASSLRERRSSPLSRKKPMDHRLRKWRIQHNASPQNASGMAVAALTPQIDLLYRASPWGKN
jgi:hypothetical protein